MDSKWINSFQEIITQFDHFIFDCDGVLWNEQRYFDEARKALNYFQSKDKNLIFLSNVNRVPRSQLREKICKEFGFPAKVRNCYTAAYITASVISEHFPFIKNLYLVGRQGLQKELESFGFHIFGGYKDDAKKLTVKEVEHLKINKDIQGVICGSDDYINFYKIAYAANIVKRTKYFFGTNFDDYAWVTDDLLCPGAYTYISAIETASGHKALITSKPSTYSMEVIMKESGLKEKDKRRMLMIGDTLRTDIQFAENCKISSCLVFSGFTRKEEFFKLSRDERKKLPFPDYIADSVKI